MNDLYPLKFKPVFKEKIWGGNRLKELLKKPVENLSKVGESWEISGIEGSLSEVINGFLAGNDILDLIEVYMGDLVGDSVFERFGIHFPLLIKFIDANDYLSVQVHPDDELALQRHQSYGKNEMWYIVDAEKDAELILGFNQVLDKEKYLDYFNSGRLKEILNYEKVSPGDVLFMPAGRVHATGPGILFAEIQQTSDITYRIYDWDRLDDNGNSRELHADLALDALDFTKPDSYKTSYEKNLNERANLVACPYFTTNLIEVTKTIELDYLGLDSFVVFMAMEGHVEIVYNEAGDVISLHKGETILVPAVIPFIKILPKSASAKVLEVYIDTDN